MEIGALAPARECRTQLEAALLGMLGRSECRDGKPAERCLKDVSGPPL